MSCNHKHESGSNNNKVELADILKDEINNLQHLDSYQRKILNAIINCRTSILGGHINKCESCGHIEVFYNSCRNRHCPKCGSLAKARWISNRISELLPVEYFHIVFTVPDILNQLFLYNKKLLYSILFKSVKETLICSAKSTKNIGANIGFISVLHTWGQNLMDHPHIHCVVPGGGISLDNSKWINCKKGFFVSVRILSTLFKKKFLFYLKKLSKSGKLRFESSIQEFQEILDKCYIKNWVVYSKRPFSSPKHVLSYLGRYTHKIAISNNRILLYQNGKVTFRYRDYKDNCKYKKHDS